MVTIGGFMAPPLKAKGNFFVLTRAPVALCPFCESDKDWPDDILVVYFEGERFFTFGGRAILVSGTLERGSFTDPTTGFVSQVRLRQSTWREVP
jgi:hypothetical protein